MNLLDFVGIYGTILAPIGGIIVVDHFLADAVGIPRDPAARSGSAFNMVVFVSWLVPVAVAMWLYQAQGVFASYLPLPSAIACGLLYIVLSRFTGPATIAGAVRNPAGRNLTGDPA
jgi:NCS1 family nucleobase:cation symporter-1